jgi:hypothetical protein
VRGGRLGYPAGVLRLVALLCALLGLPGCGYTVLEAGRPIDGIGSIAIRTPRNESYQPGVEFLVADALRREVLRRGRTELTDDLGGADLIVTGFVLPLTIVPRSFSSVVLALEYEVTMTVALQARRPDGSELKLDLLSMSESERYLASADVEVQRKNRQEALRRVSTILAARFFDSVAAGLSK